MGKPAPYNSKQLTQHLRDLLAQAHTMTLEGEYQTKGEALVDLVMKEALGWEESIVNDEGTEIKSVHKPQRWAIELVWDRMEGKTPQSLDPGETKMTAKDTVKALAVARLSALTAETVGEAKKGPPPLA